MPSEFGLVIVLGMFFGGGAIILVPALWFHYRDEAQKRDKQHAERMRSLEMGLPLPDAQIARSNALRSIGVGVPVAALAAALTATLLLGLYRESGDVGWAIAAIWLSCLGICVVAVRESMQRLRENTDHPSAAVARRAIVSPVNEPAEIAPPPNPTHAVFERRST